MANVAIMGYGTVGSGVHEIIKKNHEIVKKHALNIPVQVTRVLDLRDFPDHPEPELFTKDFNDILNDDSISVVAEMMGGLHPAYEFTKALLEAGKSVVTSNKELVATYGTELMEIAIRQNKNYLFEASVGGGIPVIRPMHQCLSANNVTKITGILNGTTNYILNEMFRKGKSFQQALEDAQQKGYAERNPAADVEGHDACRKIAILSSLACGKFVDYKDIQTEGITEITLEDVKYAAALDSVIKLIGYAEFMEDGTLYSVVAPMIVSCDSPIGVVNGVFNAIMVTGDCVGDVMFYGKGAGKLPTASAVVADIIDCVKHEQRCKKIAWKKAEHPFMMDPLEKEVSYFIRTTKPEEAVRALFDIETKLDGIVEGEFGFVTKKIKESQAQEKMKELGGIVSAIKLL